MADLSVLAFTLVVGAIHRHRSAYGFVRRVSYQGLGLGFGTKLGCRARVSVSLVGFRV